MFAPGGYAFAETALFQKIFFQPTELLVNEIIRLVCFFRSCARFASFE
jgi:hypothetical protein